jgi:hypothetical protein
MYQKRKMNVFFLQSSNPKATEIKNLASGTVIGFAPA